MAQSEDALWSWDAASETIGDLSVCVSPLSGCSLPAPTGPPQSDYLATDGVNVYAVPLDAWFAGYLLHPGLSCPIADYGENCTEIWAGLPGATKVVSAAAAIDENGQVGAAGRPYLFIAGFDGSIVRCPADLPWTEEPCDAGTCGTDQSSSCVLLDDAGNRMARGMVVADGYLWAGLMHRGLTGGGLLWRCDLWTENSCADFDDPKGVDIYAVDVGGGYLWAGRQDGVIWRCDMGNADSCAVWDKAGESVMSVSYDGQGTLYAAISGTNTNKTNAVIWSCSTAGMNQCGKVPAAGGATQLNQAFEVAAGPGGVFNVSGWSSCSGGDCIANGVLFDSQFLNSQNDRYWSNSLIYIPAGGPRPLSPANVRVPFAGEVARLGERCQRGGKLMADFAVSGPYGMQLDRKVDLCELWNGGQPVVRFGGLDSGDYTVKAHVERYFGEATFSVDDGLTEVDLQLIHPSQWRAPR